MKYIYHHLGLGDHIICNGLVRHLQKQHKKVSVFCKYHNTINVSYMFRDNEDIQVIGVNDDEDVINYIQKNKISNELIVVGFNKLSLVEHKRFDEGFYKSVDLPFSYRFEKFYVERDLDLENKILDELNPKKEKYIFVHGVDLSRVRKDFKIIQNPIQYNIFNLISLIENSEEVHLMESSLKNLVNSYKMEKPNFFYHQYSRNYPEYNNTQGLNNFEIIN